MSILNFQKPDEVIMINEEANQGNFEFRPLEPGYGLTVGNALRRVLLSSLEGFAITSFTITETGTVEDAVALEGYCGDPEDPNAQMRECSIFNSASVRASLKLKYKPKIVDGKPTAVEAVKHRFTFKMEKND